MKAILKEYRISDNQLLEKAQVFLNYFIKNKAEMVAVYTELNDPFADEFQLAIDYADEIPSDYEVAAQISVPVEEIRKKMFDAKNAIQKLFMYVRLGWDSKVKLKAFGQDDYLKATTNYSNMINLLNLSYRMSNDADNKAVLLSVGYSQAEIDNLLIISNEIETIYDEIEDLKSERLETTLKRKMAMNNVYNFMKKLNKASKIAFVDNTASLNVFKLNKSKKKKAEGVIEEA